MADSENTGSGEQSTNKDAEIDEIDAMINDIDVLIESVNKDMSEFGQSMQRRLQPRRGSLPAIGSPPSPQPQLLSPQIPSPQESPLEDLPLQEPSTEDIPLQEPPPEELQPQELSPQMSSPHESPPEEPSPQELSPQMPSPHESSPQIPSPQEPSPQMPSPRTPSPQTSSQQTPSPKTPPGHVRISLPVPPPSNEDLSAQIDQIHSFCDTVDRSLAGVFLVPDFADFFLEGYNRGVRANEAIRSTGDFNRDSYASPLDMVEEIIELTDSESPAQFEHPTVQDGDDDVVITSANFPPIVDLSNILTPPVHVTRVRPINRRRRSNNMPNATAGSADEYVIRARSPLRAVQISTTNMGRQQQPPVIQFHQVPQQQQQHEYNQRANRSRLSSSDATPHIDTAHTSSSNNNESTRLICSVCMESMLNKEPTSTKCGHVFCARCIREAIRVTRKCPLCNKKLTNSNLFRIYL